MTATNYWEGGTCCRALKYFLQKRGSGELLGENVNLGYLITILSLNSYQDVVQFFQRILHFVDEQI